jgi:hypothetical protein
MLAGVDAAVAMAATIAIVRPLLGLNNEVRTGNKVLVKSIHASWYRDLQPNH